MLPDYDPEYVDYLFSRLVHDISDKYIIEIFTKYFDCTTEQVEQAQNALDGDFHLWEIMELRKDN